MGSHPRLFPLAALLLLVAPPRTVAASLRVQEKYPALGITVDAPPKYDPIPVQPSERHVVLRWVGKGDGEPELALVRLDVVADPVPLPDPPPVTSLPRFVAQRMESWKAEPAKPAKGREGFACSEYELKDNKNGLRGWACELKSADRVWILIGMCARDQVDKELPGWRRCAEKLEFFEPAAQPAGDKWTKFYARNPAFRSPELRINLRSRLVGDWQAEDTPNYLVVYHTKKESLVNHLEKRLEGIRRSYVELFPPAGEITAVSTLRICENEEEYRQYGGSEGTAGYWNPRSEELVVFVFDAEGSSTASSLPDAHIVLFHEAFHQYIHYAAGELAPHSWFNEGYGDYFSGAEFNQAGEVGKIQPNPWRFTTIRYAIGQHQTPPWSEMVSMEQADYYGPNRGVNYAMGWSMIYFLNKAPQVKKRPEWKKILPTYFDTLKAAHARERARLEQAGLDKNPEEVEKAAKKAREEAVKAAFDDVDMREIEDAWESFTLEMKGPK